ncbi:hypothetical protein SAY86_021354 [Trapa natans]|uniref:Transmembrane protein 120 homolog n=1 Tax=Trapa natans TaxID=22666 RepID=A0AAN7REQ4_TRANT|nr:hypothetical protein SAY86_021354 [Trapa natans]
MDASEKGRVEEEVKMVVEQAKELQDLAAAFIAKTSGEEQSIRQRAATLDSNIRRLQSLIHSLLEHKLLDQTLADKLNEELQRARFVITDGEASAFLTSKAQGGFLRMFLGPINVRASKKDIQLKVKEEYNSYRDRTALLFLLFPSALLMLRSWLWNGCLPAFPVQLYQAWLLFLYTGLALRENILRVNGSDIRPWWIYHHYCAMVMALVSLTWEIKGQPNCAQKQRGVQLFLQWAIMQEKKRAHCSFSEPYTLFQLLTFLPLRGLKSFIYLFFFCSIIVHGTFCNQAKRMDVVWGETAGVDGQLWLLCPVLFIMQVVQFIWGLLLCFLKYILVPVLHTHLSLRQVFCIYTYINECRLAI